MTIEWRSEVCLLTISEYIELEPIDFTVFIVVIGKRERGRSCDEIDHILESRIGRAKRELHEECSYFLDAFLLVTHECIYPRASLIFARVIDIFREFPESESRYLPGRMCEDLDEEISSLFPICPRERVDIAYHLHDEGDNFVFPYGL